MIVNDEKIEDLKIHMIILKAFADGLNNTYLNSLLYKINNIIDSFCVIDSEVVVENNVLKFPVKK